MQLPESVQEIADVIGRDRALFLIGKLPRYYSKGTQSERVILYVPKNLPLDHRLVQILGWNDASKLAKEFGGEILKPSNCNFIQRKARDKSILEMHAQGYSAQDLAKWFYVCERTVKNLLREKAQEVLTTANDNNAVIQTDKTA
jgi:DNA-binding NarL/FixJ family response regulator